MREGWGGRNPCPRLGVCWKAGWEGGGKVSCLFLQRRADGFSYTLPVRPDESLHGRREDVSLRSSQGEVFV
ncbi:hypothetical protein LZ30DRAFT_46934 [Colletotrichum cereale]|nr:hypothetical protein LZ30DRAFT_46934 [Colletotrichum cereale]